MFRGAYTALVTPMRDGRVDTDALEKLVEDQIAGGIHGLVPCGTTGESPSLSHAEHIHVVEVVMQAVRGRVPVLAGAGSNSTREAIELARACKELGVQGTLQITPYYNKPTQDGLVAHFSEIADAVGLPIVVYNVPSRTCVDLLPETAARLAQYPLLVGIKEATACMIRASRLRELCGPDFAMLSGDDFTIMPFMAVGGDGVIERIAFPNSCGNGRAFDQIIAIATDLVKDTQKRATAIMESQWRALERLSYQATSPQLAAFFAHVARIAKTS